MANPIMSDKVSIRPKRPIRKFWFFFSKTSFIIAIFDKLQIANEELGKARKGYCSSYCNPCNFDNDTKDKFRLRTDQRTGVVLNNW